MSNDVWSDGFRERLSVLLQRYGISKAAMARLCGLPPRTLENYFKGHKPGVDALLSISRGLGIDVDWLLGEDSNKKTFNTDLVGEAVYIAATAMLKDLRDRSSSKAGEDSSDVLGQPIDRVVRLLERAVIQEYLELRRDYARISAEEASEARETEVQTRMRYVWGVGKTAHSLENAPLISLHNF